MNQSEANRTPVIGQEEEVIDIKDLLLRIWRIWPYIAFSVIVAIGIAYISLRYSVPEYQVSSKFFVKEKENPFSLFESAGLNMGGSGDMELGNQMIILKSRPIANAALDLLNFDVEYYAQGRFLTTEVYQNTPVAVAVDWNHPQLTNGDLLIQWTDRKQFTVSYISESYTQIFPDTDGRKKLDNPGSPSQKYNFNEWVELPMNRFKVGLTSAEDSGEMIIRFRDRHGLINHYTGENLQIAAMDKQSTILKLTVNTHTPEKGRDYLNTLQEVYLENELQEKNAMATNTIDFIDAQLVVLSDSLMFIENRLENFRSNNSIYDLSSEGTAIFEQLKELENELAKEKFKRDYYQQLTKYLEREDYNQVVVPSGLGIEDPILNTLITNLLELQAEKSMHASKLTEISPPLREVNRKIKDLNLSILELLQNVDNNAQLLIEDLQERINKITGTFSSLPQTEQNLLRIQREFSLNEELYTFLLEKRAESAITRASNTPSNKIIESALINPIPISPKTALTYLIALILGVALPIGISFARAFLSNTIKDGKELERKADLNLISTVGESEENDNLVVLKKHRSGITEAFRSLRANMNFILPKDKSSVILITSSISGEGKTFCSINLASVYALSNKRTLLIGCDMRKPKIFEDFGINNKEGLSTYLSQNQEDVDKVIQKTAYENLDVIVSGPIPPNPAELLITDRFGQLLAEMKGRYDMVILDTPPVGLVSETLDLIRLADISLFVVRYNYSEKQFIDHINNLKKQAILKEAYMVFNGVDKDAQHYGYGTGYGCGYGYGYGYYAEDNKERNFFKKLFKLK